MQAEQKAPVSCRPYKVTKAQPDEPEIEQPPLAGLCPKVHFRLILSGPSKSGKTNLARWLLDNCYTMKKNKSFFDRIYLMSPTAKIDFVWHDLAGLKPSDRIVQPTPATLQRIFNKQKSAIGGGGGFGKHGRALARRKKKADKILIIFDDAIAESKLMNSPEFLKVFVAGRHYNISSMVMSQ